MEDDTPASAHSNKEVKLSPEEWKALKVRHHAALSVLFTTKTVEERLDLLAAVCFPEDSRLSVDELGDRETPEQDPPTEVRRCTQCDVEYVVGGAIVYTPTCKACWDRRKGRVRRAAGFCTRCRTHPREEGYAYCAQCRPRHAEYHRRRRREKVAA